MFRVAVRESLLSRLGVWVLGSTAFHLSFGTAVGLWWWHVLDLGEWIFSSSRCGVWWQRAWVVPSVCVSWSPWCVLVTTALQSWCVLGGVALLLPSLSPCEHCCGLGFSVCALGLWCRISFTGSFGFLVHLVALLRRGCSLHV